MDTQALKHFPLSHLQLRQIADSGVVGIVFWDTSGRIHEANDRFLEILGYSREDLAGGRLDWTSLTPEKWQARDREAIERLKSRGIARAEEKEYLRKDGAQIFVRLHSTMLHGESDKAISIVVDVTEQKRSEAQRLSLMERETQARSEAESAVRSRDDILAIVSHDLRNPLNIIGMSAKLLDSSLPEAKRSAQLGIIQRAVGGINRLIEDLLDVTQITSGKLRVDTAPVEVAEICEDARAMFVPLLAAKNQAFECTLPSAPVAVLADRDRIGQVLSNLVGNAHKFTPEGGRIGLQVDIVDDCARFTISDTGPGLSSQDLPHVFDRFWQARRVRRGGVGLGLPITKGIIDAHGGCIWAESSAGRGTTFYFTLPLSTSS